MSGATLRRKAQRRGWANTAAGTGWGESTYAELAWDKSRGASLRWAVLGAVLGLLIGVIAFAPAAWMARAVASATGQRLLLTDARGTVWSGSAVVVLAGGPDSHDASALPGRLEWNMGVKGAALEMRAQHACCLNETMRLQVRQGWGRRSITLIPGSGNLVGQWPSAWLAGLGAPFNTLQLGGSLRLTSQGLTLENVQGRWLVQGRADLDIMNLSSRVSTLDTLGSYHLSISADDSGASGAQVLLNTLDGPLQLSGNGTWGLQGFRFRGEARAASGDESGVSNLLNIIGRRQGDRSVFSIG